jgi:hypothetical protein
MIDKRGGYSGGGHASKMMPPARLPKVEPGPAPGAFALRVDSDWTQQDYQTLRDSIVIDGVAYSRQRLREILHERHLLADQNLRLTLERKELRERLRRNAVHLQRRTAALTRLIARKAL